MNNELTFKVDSDLDIKLMAPRYQLGTLASSQSWSEYLYQLDSNIMKVDYEYGSGYTTLTFTTESHKTWFILRWS